MTLTAQLRSCHRAPRSAGPSAAFSVAPCAHVHTIPSVVTKKPVWISRPLTVMTTTESTSRSSTFRKSSAESTSLLDLWARTVALTERVEPILHHEDRDREGGVLAQVQQQIIAQRGGKDDWLVDLLLLF